MTTKRLRRGIPGKVPVIEIQDRDLNILECLGRLRHVPTDLLAAHFWGATNSDPAMRRLRRLLDAKLVKVTLVGSRSCNVFSLSARGYDVLSSCRGVLDGVRIAEPIRAAAGLRHATLVAAMRLYLSALSDAGHGELLRWSGGRSAVATELGLAACHLQPDGIGELQMRRSCGFAVCEADTGFEHAELQSKLRKYQAFFGLRTESAVQLWIAAEGGDGRIATVERWVKEAGLARWSRVFRSADLYQRPALPPAPRLDRPRGQIGP